MVAPPDEFAQYCCELLAAAGPCTARRMFGGHGISTGGLTLALLADLGQGQTLRLKAVPDTCALFEAAGCERFTYQAKGKARHLGFYSAPSAAMESASEMAPWAHLALQAALTAGCAQAGAWKKGKARARPRAIRGRAKKEECMIKLLCVALCRTGFVFLTLATMHTFDNGDLTHKIGSHRDYLLRFARLQLRNDTWAEDAVSETLLAALSKPQAFEHRAQLKTWLVGILKHKVIDALRQQRREVSLCGKDDDEANADDLMDQALFKADGHFAEQPAHWGNPEQDLSSRQFFAVLEACVGKLPASQGRLFLMREWLELPSDEICKELGLSPTNLYVQLHRARQRLRECLELNWFTSPKVP